MLFWVVFYSSRSFSRLLWFLTYLFQVVCTSSRFFLNLYVPHPGCFLINPSSFLSWFLFPTYLGCFSSIRVLSDLVLVLAAPCRGSFLINPGSFWSCLGPCRTLSGFFFINLGSFWSCLGSCRILSGFFFDQSGFFLKLSCYLQHLFRVVFWLFRVLSELVCSSFGLFSDQSGFFLNLSWYLQHLFGVVCASSRFFLNLYVPHPGCFLINPGSFWTSSQERVFLISWYRCSSPAC